MEQFRNEKEELALMIQGGVSEEKLVSYIYDRTNEEMMEIAKKIKEGIKISSLYKKAFERVLDMRYCERIEVYNYYYAKNLESENVNTMKLYVVTAETFEGDFGTDIVLLRVADNEDDAQMSVEFAKSRGWDSSIDIVEINKPTALCLALYIE